MNDLNCIRIKYNIAFILFVLIIVAILGWCMLVLPSMNIGDDIRYLVIAGVSFLLIEGVIRLVIFKILRIKSKDDFSQVPKFIVTEYINVNKNILSKILLIPNIVYCLLLVVYCLFIRRALFARPNAPRLLLGALNTFVSFCYLK